MTFSARHALISGQAAKRYPFPHAVHLRRSYRYGQAISRAGIWGVCVSFLAKAWASRLRPCHDVRSLPPVFGSPLALFNDPGFAQFDRTGLDEGDVAAGATSGWLTAVGAKECES